MLSHSPSGPRWPRAFGVHASALGALVTVSGMLAAAAAGAAGVVEHPDVASRIALYELWAQDQMRYQHQPGVVIAVVHGSEIVWSRAFGVRDVESGAPMTTDTVFRMGSVSKLFTSTAILQLRDEGRLQLDDPLVRHLPWFEVHDRFLDDPPITIRHLLTHTSGLAREAPMPYWTDREFPTLEQLRTMLPEQQNVYPTQTRYKYSNLGMALLGAVVAVASGEPYERYVSEHILEPLGMSSSWARYEELEGDAGGRARLATGYLVSRADGFHPVAPETRSNAIGPAADYSSTAEDMARFLAAHMAYQSTPADVPSRGRVLRGSTLREMQRVHWLSESWQSGRGLGFSVYRQEGRTLAGHGGWVAGFRTQVAIDPEARLGVVVLTNSDEGGPGSYVRQAVAMLWPAIEAATSAPDLPETAAPAPPVLTVGELERYAGAYHNPWGEVTEVLAFEGRLVMWDHGYPPSSDPLGGLTDLLPVGEHTFRQSDESGNGEPVIFEMRDDGGVARLKNGANYLYPEGCGEIVDLECSWGP